MCRKQARTPHFDNAHWRAWPSVDASLHVRRISPRGRGTLEFESKIADTLD